MYTNTSENEFLTLRGALDEADDIVSDEEVDVVLLPPANTSEGDTDNEFGDIDNLGMNTLHNVQKVDGTVVVQSSRDTSRISKPKKVYEKLPPNYKRLIRTKILNTNLILNDDTDHNTKVNNLVESATHFDSLRNWVETCEDNKGKGLSWEPQMTQENILNFENLNSTCAGKMPVEIFELLFNERLQEHVVTVTL